MQISYKQAQSAIKPLAIDLTSSPGGVYVRRNIKQLVKESETGEKNVYFDYEEAFLTKSEYEEYSHFLIMKSVKQEDNSSAFEIYQAKLDTPVQYSNGFYYKAKWAETVYADLIQKGIMFPQLFPLKIWDATETEENAASMTMQELTLLTMFLAQKQEEFFAEYKRAKTAQEGELVAE